MAQSNPIKGDIAICSAGRVGLITSEEPVEITYPDGNTGVAWTGIHLAPYYGAMWSSREPEVIARRREDGTYEPMKDD